MALADTAVCSAMQSIIQHDGEVQLFESFIDNDEAWLFYHDLCGQLAWRQETLNINGRSVPAPRLTCWYGDPGAVYTYSGVRNIPLPWVPVLLSLRERLGQFTGRDFNSVLANLYRDGNDSVGWHADKEQELGVNPVIASLSFGDTRLFKLRHNKSRETVDVPLAHGSLLLMAGCLQRCWRHCVPKTRREKSPRINLTFRTVVNPPPGV